MELQELRAIKLQHLKADMDCLNKRYKTLDIEDIADIFMLRCKAQNIANTLLEIETLNEYELKNGKQQNNI